MTVQDLIQKLTEFAPELDVLLEVRTVDSICSTDINEVKDILGEVRIVGGD